MMEEQEVMEEREVMEEQEVMEEMLFSSRHHRFTHRFMKHHHKTIFIFVFICGSQRHNRHFKNHLGLNKDV